MLLIKSPCSLYLTLSRFGQDGGAYVVSEACHFYAVCPSSTKSETLPGHTSVVEATGQQGTSQGNQTVGSTRLRVLQTSERSGGHQDAPGPRKAGSQRAAGIPRPSEISSQSKVFETHRRRPSPPIYDCIFHDLTSDIDSGNSRTSAAVTPTEPPSVNALN